MMPARRAAWSGSPFRVAPRRIAASAFREIAMDPRAFASRCVVGLLPTSTITTRPRASMCDGRLALDIALAPCTPPAPAARRRGNRGWGADAGPWAGNRAGRQHSVGLGLSACEIEGQALEGHREVHALQLHVGRNLKRPWRE